jgi:hypothetical protein
MRSHWILLLAAALPLPSSRAAQAPDPYAVIHVAPAKTSIYIGRLLVTPSPFVRTASGYTSNLSLELFPYFYHDDAKVYIDVPEAKVMRLQGGNAIEFKGRVVRRNGQSRKLTGRAVPTGNSAGKLSILVYLTSKVTVAFNTTYTLLAPAR